jgi:hypothetical protein
MSAASGDLQAKRVADIETKMTAREYRIIEQEEPRITQSTYRRLPELPSRRTGPLFYISDFT